MSAHAPRVTVELRLNKDEALLFALFRVHSTVPAHVNAELPLVGSQWGLWEWDVVELFVSCGGSGDHLPYYEFQVSPLGQYFELEIFEPRKRFNREFLSGFKHEVRPHADGGWEAELTLPLSRMGWDGNPASIVGNAFAILGAPPERSYHSLFLGPQTKPDFHLPSEFRRLV